VTTVLADARLGLMVSDSNISDGTRVWTGKKVHRIHGSLIGCAGSLPQIEAFLAWFRAGADISACDFALDESYFLILNKDGLFEVEQVTGLMRHVKSGREAIGSGAVFAIAAYEALNWMDPRRAVAIACKHDTNSRAPVRQYHLNTRKAI
jgi:ATP-dependent protease HslVU (ClpYQ) peptidase subunit